MFGVGVCVCVSIYVHVACVGHKQKPSITTALGLCQTCEPPIDALKVPTFICCCKIWRHLAADKGNLCIHTLIHLCFKPSPAHRN